MKNILRRGLLGLTLSLSSLSLLSAQTKIEAESFTSKKDGSTEIVTEQEGKSIGYFDEEGEKLVYDINVEEAGMYQFSVKFVSKDDGYLKFELEDGSYYNYNVNAYLELGDNWWQLAMSNWEEYPYEKGPSFYLEAGKHTFTVTNGGIAINIDYFSMKKSSVTDSKVAQVKTNPSKLSLMPNESVVLTPTAYNAAGDMIAVPAKWSSNVKDGIYTAGASYGTDFITVDMGGVEKKINVSIEKPKKKKEFVVSKYGALNTNDGAVRDASGNKVCLMGPSLFWSCSAPLWWSAETVDFLVDQYNIQILRLPVAIAPCGETGQTSCTSKTNPDTWNKFNYIQSPEYTKKLVDDVVKACIENDIYVIIDFHEHKAEDWTNESKEFFQYFASKWGEFPNVMYEIYNEPLYDVDNSIVISYAKQVIPAIRAIDKDNIIIVGSKRFSREPDQVTSAGEGYSNIAYTWHGYVVHGHAEDWNGHSNWNNGVPVVVTEWGVDGNRNDGGLLSTYQSRGVINCFWSMSNLGGADAVWSVLKSSCSKKAGWSESDMNDNGAWLLSKTKSWVNFTPVKLDVPEDLSMTICASQKFFMPQNETTISGEAAGGSGNYTYTWKQTNGPSQAVIASANSAETKVTFSEAGSYTFMLSVSDGEEDLSETVSITILPEGYVDPGTIDDVNDNDIITMWGGRWDIFDDSDKEADKHSKVTEAEKLASDGIIKAEISMGSKWNGGGFMGDPYCGVEVYLNSDETGLDLTDCEKITYMFKGSAHEFRAEVSSIDDSNFHGTSVSEANDWTEVTINWSSLKQDETWGKKVDFDKTDIRKFSWQVKGDANSQKTLAIDNLVCVGMTNPNQEPGTGVNAISVAEGFTIYPNPAKDGKCFIVVPELCNVTITNIAGQLVRTFTAIPNIPNEVQLPSQGIYIISANGNRAKLVVE